jgi:hypothetical protein
MGRDIEEIFDELQSEEALASKYGIELSVAEAPPAPPMPPEDGGTKALTLALARSLAEPRPAGNTTINTPPVNVTLNQGEVRNEITVQPAEASAVNVTNEIHEREQPAPVINFNPTTNVAAPEVTVEVDAILPAETEMRITSLPDRITTTEIKRDGDGNIQTSTQIERDA